MDKEKPAMITYDQYLVNNTNNSTQTSTCTHISNRKHGQYEVQLFGGVGQVLHCTAVSLLCNLQLTLIYEILLIIIRHSLKLYFWS